MRCIVGLAIASALTNSALACSISDIAVKQADWHREQGGIRIISEIVNNCSSPTGVQVQAVFRDASGKVVRTWEYWPASTRNIASGDSVADSGLYDPLPDATTMNFRIIEVHHWD